MNSSKFYNLARPSIDKNFHCWKQSQLSKILLEICKINDRFQDSPDEKKMNHLIFSKSMKFSQTLKKTCKFYLRIHIVMILWKLQTMTLNGIYYMLWYNVKKRQQFTCHYACMGAAVWCLKMSLQSSFLSSEHKQVHCGFY